MQSAWNAPIHNKKIGKHWWLSYTNPMKNGSQLIICRMRRKEIYILKRESFDDAMQCNSNHMLDSVSILWVHGDQVHNRIINNERKEERDSEWV